MTSSLIGYIPNYELCYLLLLGYVSFLLPGFISKAPEFFFVPIYATWPEYKIDIFIFLIVFGDEKTNSNVLE
jgi:hypothetical protein